MTNLQPDLVGCDAEPIRVPGSIQPHGWLLALAFATGRIVAYSDNCSVPAGLPPGPALVATLQALAQTLRPALESTDIREVPIFLGVATLGGQTVDASAHRAGPLVVIELEPASPNRGIRAPIYSLARGLVTSLQGARSVVELAALGASEMKRLTGFGRCLVYCFDDAGHGEVLAERADAGYDRYLGHRFPAADIPLQARALYLANPIRLIVDANYTPSPLHVVDGAPPQSIDLSFAQLRSVSPIHLEYMRNMGTLASMSVSIIVDGRLWGLISCHDREPRGLDLDTRFACEHLGRLLSLQIEAKAGHQDDERRHELKDLTLRLVSRLGESQATLQSLVDEQDMLLGLADASGAAVVFDGQCWTTGRTPSHADVLALAEWLAGAGVAVYDTDSLAATRAPSPAEPAHAAGLLAISLSQVHRHLVLWFRPELVRTIVWAGEPQKDADPGGRLHPRLSFNSWEQTVRGRSAPWTSSEIAAASELRQALLGIVLQRAQERAEAAGKLGRAVAARELAEQASSAKTRFMAIVSHELRTPLAAIANAAAVLERTATVPANAEGLLPMIQRNIALEARLIDDLLDLSVVSTGKLGLSIETVDLSRLVDQVVELLKQEIAAKDLDLAVQPSATAARVAGDPVRLQQVLWNLLRNAVKFTPRGGRIDVRTELQGDEVVFTCTDSGIGLKPASLRRIFDAFEQGDDDTHRRFGGLGLGLAIALGIVKSHGGELDAGSAGVGRGATFTVRLPVDPGDGGETATGAAGA